MIYFWLSVFIFLWKATVSMAGIFHPQTTTLSNGLQVVVVPNSLAPVVTVGIVYKIGTADDPIDQVGLSHFLEHMMFKGTKTVPGAAFKKMILERGGSTNAYTSFDYTCYVTTIERSQLSLLLELEADRMTHLTFTEAEVIAEKEVVQEERRMRLDNNPFGVMMEVMLRTTNWYHPYGVPPIGYPHHINAYSYASVRRHYETYYAPNNAILIVSGDISLAEVVPLAEKFFENTKAKTIPERKRVEEPDHQGVTVHLTQENKRNSLILLQWIYRAPNYRSIDSQHYYPLIVLSQILGGNSTTDFSKYFVKERKLAISISTNYDSESFDPRGFSVSATLSADMSVDHLKAALTDYLTRLKATGITQKDLEQAKKDLAAHLVFSKDGSEGAIDIFKNLAIGFSIDEIEQWETNIRAVTKEQVNEALQTVLGNAPLVTIDVRPASSQAAS